MQQRSHYHSRLATICCVYHQFLYIPFVESAMYDYGQRKGAVNKAGKSDSDVEAARKSLGSAVFPDEETEEGIFHQEVLYSVQRWFSAHGWPGGSYPISIPESLRRYSITSL